MNNSISDIKHEFEQAQSQELSCLYEKYAGDSRSGVKALILKYKKQEEKLFNEKLRLE